MRRKPTLRSAALGLLGAAYPLLILYPLTSGNLNLLVAVLLGAGALALALGVTARHRAGIPTALLMMSLGIAVLVSQDPLSSRLYPILVNLGLLGLFGLSLLYPPSVIERIARASQPDLPDAAIAYTRAVTLVWCVFFVVNASISAMTLHASPAVWAVYNGCIAYCLMGVLLGGEYLVRRVVMNTQNRNAA